MEPQNPPHQDLPAAHRASDRLRPGVHGLGWSFDKARLGFGGGSAYWRWQLIVFAVPSPTQTQCCLITFLVSPAVSACSPFVFFLSLSLSPFVPASSTVSLPLSLSLFSCLVSFSLSLPLLLYVSPIFLLSVCCFLPFSMDRGVSWPCT